MTTPDMGSSQEAPPAPGQTGGNGIAIAGLIFAILGLVVSFIGFVGLGLAILGLILAIVGAKKASKNGSGKGVAIAGIVIGIIGILVGGAFTTCQVACAAGANGAAKQAGFGSFGAMMKAAADMPKKLDAAAKKAGYKNYQEWQQKDPKAAGEAAQKLGKDLGQNIKNEAGSTGGTGAGAPAGGGGTGN